MTMDILNFILTGVAVSTVFATIAATFYGVRQKTIITTLRESNDAYKERNVQLEQMIKDRDAAYAKDIAELKGKVSVLEKMKTPPLTQMIEQINKNHLEVMAALRKQK